MDIVPPCEVSGWETLVLDSGEDALHEKIRCILRSASTPWRDIDCVPKSPVQESVMNNTVAKSKMVRTVQQSVMNVLQEV